MEPIRFSAFALEGELELNRLAARLNISRKYRWEEPMRLNPVTFTPAQTAMDCRSTCIPSVAWFL